MKIEAARLAIEPRSAGECIDLACLFYRAHFVKLVALSAVVGVPATAAAYWTAVETDTAWLWTMALFFFISPFLGAAVVAGAGRWVFGEPFTLGNALNAVRRRWGTLLALLLTTRLILAGSVVACWGLVFLPLAARYGFLSEVVLLEQMRGTRIDKRIGELMRHTAWTAMGRYFLICCFAAGVFLSLFTLIDITSGVVFGAPILVGRVSSSFSEAFFYFLLYDPLVLSAASAALWVIYPLARLAWFFCYLDARIRKEGWDVELAFRMEARRLQPVR